MGLMRGFNKVKWLILDILKTFFPVPFICSMGETLIRDLRYCCSSLISCFCRPTFSSRTSLSCCCRPAYTPQTSRPSAPRPSRGGIVVKYDLERPCLLPRPPEPPPLGTKAPGLPADALPLVAPPHGAVWPRPASRSWPLLPGPRGRPPSGRGFGLPVLEWKVVCLFCYVWGWRWSRDTPLFSLTQEVVVLMKRPLPRPVLVHEVKKHFQWLPVATLGEGVVCLIL